MDHLFKVNFFGKDTLFLELLVKLFQEQGIFACENINVENCNADIDVHIFENAQEYDTVSLSARKQILIFPNIDFHLLKKVLADNVILIGDYKTPLNLFNLIDFDLLVHKNNSRIEERKGYISSIVFTKKSYKGRNIYTF